jgi:hypothetical protein
MRCGLLTRSGPDSAARSPGQIGLLRGSPPRGQF